MGREEPDGKAHRKYSNTILTVIYNLHLYSTKGEALFKACALLISWGVGVWKQDATVAYFLFSMSIVVEYAIQLIRSKKGDYLQRVFPFILVISNSIVYIFSLSQMSHNINTISGFEEVLAIITVTIISFDMLCTLLLDVPEKCTAEAKISQLGNATPQEDGAGGQK